jgi:hypothetical protein
MINTVIALEPKIRSEKRRILGVKDQIELFESCVYIIGDDHIFIGKHYDCKRGSGICCFSKQEFNRMFGGYKFVIEEEPKQLIKSAWDTFLYSNLIEFPKVNFICFQENVIVPYFKIDVGTDLKLLVVSPGLVLPPGQ